MENTSVTKKLPLALVASFLLFSITTHAALVARDLDGNLSTIEAYYDTDQDITWLADANYARTSGYDADGLMNWTDANVWADSLNLGGYTDWRLPYTVDVGNDGFTSPNVYEGVDAGFNITTHSEMSYMYYEILDNIAYFDTSGIVTGCASPDYCLTNREPFSNLQAIGHWSATEFAPNNISTAYAWIFVFASGSQNTMGMGDANELPAWAVHDGDVGASVVPVPAAVWLFGSTLLGLVGLQRKAKLKS